MNLKIKIKPLNKKGKEIRDKIFKGIDIFFLLSFTAFYISLPKKDFYFPLLLLGSFGFGRVISHVIENVFGLSFKKGKLEGQIEQIKNYDKIINSYEKSMQQLYEENKRIKMGGVIDNSKEKKETKTDILRRFFSKK